MRHAGRADDCQMIRKILVSSDGSALAELAVSKAIELAKATGASVVAVMVTEPPPLRMYGYPIPPGTETQSHYDDEQQQLSLKILEPIKRAAQAAGVPCAGSSVSSRSPGDAIVAAAEHEGCDLICIAMHQTRSLLGANPDRTTTRVLARARVPVLLCH